MTAFSIFLILIPTITLLLLLINFIFAKHEPYLEKDSPFECGYHSFLGQSRTQFSISFFIFGLLFLLFDLEILLVFPYSVTGFVNEYLGLSVFILFFIILTLGFIFELGKGALSITSRQYDDTNTNSKNTLKKEFYSNYK
jgi:NADH-ubiquinone oxidoreductase chain 3